MCRLALCTALFNKIVLCLYPSQAVIFSHLVSLVVVTFLQEGKSLSFLLSLEFLVCSQETSATTKTYFNNFQSH